MNAVRFTLEDADRAADTWGANCGPGAIAAVLGMTLDELRPHMGDFEKKRYTNPTLMWQVLIRLGVRYSVSRANEWPAYGLARVQWTGPWTKPGVPARVAYRHTHWVGCDRRTFVGKRQSYDSIGIFDINAITNGSGWCALDDWQKTLVPWLLEACEPKADGGWFITHSVEVQKPMARAA